MILHILRMRAAERGRGPDDSACGRGAVTGERAGISGVCVKRDDLEATVVLFMLRPA